MNPRRFSALTLPLAAVAFLTFTIAQGAPSDRDGRNKLRETEKELEHTRDNLHEAMKELANQKEKIEDLEKALREKESGGKREGREKKMAKKEDKEAAKKPDTAKKPEAPKSEPARKPQPVPRLFSFTCEEKKAANLEGREAALNWVRAQIERNAAVRLRITGHANDSEYGDTNQDIADNRARFLADYLAVSGIDRKVLAEVKGEVSKQKGEAGRRVLVEVLPEGKKG